MRRRLSKVHIVDNTLNKIRSKLASTMTSKAATVDYFEAKLLETATECQQNFYEICSDWNIYQKEEYVYLRDFLGYAMFGPPEFKETTTPDSNVKSTEFKHFVYKDKQREAINLVFDKVIQYGTNEKSDGVVLCGIIYNVIFNKDEAIKATQDGGKKNEKDDEKNYNVSKDDKKEEDNSNDVKEKADESKSDAKVSKYIEMVPQVYPVPVFRVRAYHYEKEKKNNNDAKENIEKTYYIDCAGRVYDGFGDYLTNNTLPVCTMVLPKDGRYQADPAVSCNASSMKQNVDNAVTKVWIEIHESPASKTAAKVCMGGDIASTVVTVASMGVGLAAMVTPIGAGVALASAVGAGVSGLWTVGRCVQNLADRGQHGESISITDKNALGAWIGIAGGTMGVAATGGTVLLARAVRTGTTVGRAATIAYDAVQIGNMVVNGVGVGFKSYDIYNAYVEGGISNVSVKEVLFLTAHVFFFCNSVMNHRLARNLIESTQGQLLKDYEASLRSNRHRKEFQRMARNTRAAGTNDVASNEEIIRAINKIDNRDEFFQAMVRNRKAFSAGGAKASFTSGGKVSVNGVMTIDPIEFASLPKDIRVDIVKGVRNVQTNNNPVAKPSISAASGNNEVSYKNFTANSNNVLKEFCLKHSNAMIQSAPVKIADFANVLGDLRNVKNQAEIFMKLLEIGYKILQGLPRDEEITVGDTLAYIVQFLWDYVKVNLRQLRPGMIIEDPSVQLLLNELIQILICRVDSKIDVWVKAFTRWLRTQFPQSIKGPVLIPQMIQ